MRGITRDTFWRWYRASKYGKSSGKTPREFAQLCHYKGFITWTEQRHRKPDNVTLKIAIVRGPILETWQQIAVEIEQACTLPGGPKLTNMLCIECCLDQDNLTTYEGNERWVAEDIISKAADRFGYEPVLKYLSQNIKLI